MESQNEQQLATSNLARILRRDRLFPKEVAQVVYDLAVEAQKDPRFHTWVRQKVAHLTTGQEGKEMLPYHALSMANTLLAAIRDVVRYVEDPASLELIYHPSRVMDQIQKNGRFSGDCDDATAFALACLQSVNLRSRAKLVGFDAANPGRYTHIFPEVWLSNTWVAVDTTLDNDEAIEMTNRIKAVYAVMQ